VLISSHVLSEVQQTVDDVVIIARGRLVRSGPLAELSGGGAVRAITPDPAALVAALTAAGVQARAPRPDEVLATGVTPADVGHVAFTARVELHGLAPAASDLEAIFLQLVEGPPAAQLPPPAAPAAMSAPPPPPAAASEIVP
jgi:ABC-2 type transport system ATP-binding protein